VGRREKREVIVGEPLVVMNPSAVFQVFLLNGTVARVVKWYGTAGEKRWGSCSVKPT